MVLSLINFVSDGSFPFELGVVTEVDEEAEFKAGCFEVVVELGAVLVCEFGDGFEFDDDFAETDEVGLVGLFEGNVFVG